MRTPRTLPALLTALLLLAASTAAAQVNAFRFDPGRVPVGQLFDYGKSRRDGGHATRLSAYVAALDRIEVLKWTHLVDPERGATVSRMDVMPGETPAFDDWGEVTLVYEGTENRAGTTARRYTIGGVGLGGQHGDLWLDATTGLMLGYELPVGDEPGYDDVRLELRGQRAMGAAEWRELQAAAVAGSQPAVTSSRASPDASSHPP